MFSSSRLGRSSTDGPSPVVPPPAMYTPEWFAYKQKVDREREKAARIEAKRAQHFLTTKFRAAAENVGRRMSRQVTSRASLKLVQIEDREEEGSLSQNRSSVRSTAHLSPEPSALMKRKSSVLSAFIRNPVFIPTPENFALRRKAEERAAKKQSEEVKLTATRFRMSLRSLALAAPLQVRERQRKERSLENYYKEGQSKFHVPFLIRPKSRLLQKQVSLTSDNPRFGSNNFVEEDIEPNDNSDEKEEMDSSTRNSYRPSMSSVAEDDESQEESDFANSNEDEEVEQNEDEGSSDEENVQEAEESLVADDDESSLAQETGGIDEAGASDSNTVEIYEEGEEGSSTDGEEENEADVNEFLDEGDASEAVEGSAEDIEDSNEAEEEETEEEQSASGGEGFEGSAEVEVHVDDIEGGEEEEVVEDFASEEDADDHEEEAVEEFASEGDADDEEEAVEDFASEGDAYDHEEVAVEDFASEGDADDHEEVAVEDFASEGDADDEEEAVEDFASEGDANDHEEEAVEDFVSEGDASDHEEEAVEDFASEGDADDEEEAVEDFESEGDASDHEEEAVEDFANEGDADYEEEAVEDFASEGDASDQEEFESSHEGEGEEAEVVNESAGQESSVEIANEDGDASEAVEEFEVSDDSDEDEDVTADVTDAIQVPVEEATAAVDVSEAEGESSVEEFEVSDESDEEEEVATTEAFEASESDEEKSDHSEDFDIEEDSEFDVLEDEGSNAMEEIQENDEQPVFVDHVDVAYEDNGSDASSFAESQPAVGTENSDGDGEDNNKQSHSFMERVETEATYATVDSEVEVGRLPSSAESVETALRRPTLTEDEYSDSEYDGGMSRVTTGTSYQSEFAPIVEQFEPTLPPTVSDSTMEGGSSGSGFGDLANDIPNVHEERDFVEHSTATQPSPPEVRTPHHSPPPTPSFAPREEGVSFSSFEEDSDEEFTSGSEYETDDSSGEEYVTESEYETETESESGASIA